MESSLPDLPASATLREWQTYVAQTVLARGWNQASDLEVFLLFSEEVGEFAKAFRRYRQLFVERIEEDRPASMDLPLQAETQNNLAEELADIQSYLLDLAERLGIDLEQALVAKEKRNRLRSWETLID